MNISPRTVGDWLHYLETLDPNKIELGLERVMHVLARLNITPFQCPVITVTGTNGKGSVVALLSEIYEAQGYRVGVYTSPHLIKFQERIRINEHLISDADLIKHFSYIDTIRGNIQLTYFEFSTLAALNYFAQQQCDVLILEVGLGGRLDAVNCIDADLAIITTIALDHLDWLGATRADVAYAKTGIFRTGKWAVCGDPNPPENVYTIAQIEQVPLVTLGSEFYFKEEEQYWHWQNVQYEDQNEINLPKPSLYLQNAATVLMGIKLLQRQLPVTRSAMDAGLISVRLPGRQQIISAPAPTRILDVAHNPQAIELLVTRLQRDFSQYKIHLVVGMMSDKDISACIRLLKPAVNEWYLTSLPSPRAATSTQLHDILIAADITNDIFTYDNPVAAYTDALQQADAIDLIVVCGSFLTVGMILEASM